MIKAKVSKIVRSLNKDMSEKYDYLESLKFKTQKEAYLHVVATFGSGFLEGRTPEYHSFNTVPIVCFYDTVKKEFIDGSRLNLRK